MLLGCNIQLNAQSLRFFSADNPKFQYVGRIDFSNPALPKYWALGVYVTTSFNGSSCKFIVQDEVPSPNAHNYVEVVIDNYIYHRIRLQQKRDTLSFYNLKNGAHKIVLCKNTETNIGYMEFAGMLCNALLEPPPLPNKRIECIGNSITCGTGSDQSVVPCHAGVWQDQHNTYFAYGPTTARNLNAQWHLTAYSGIGLVHSYCNIAFNITNIFNQLNLQPNGIPWQFSKYQPDVVTICLGQNDGKQDSAYYCKQYLYFLQTIRTQYPNAQIICLSSPMADSSLNANLQRYITAVVQNNWCVQDGKISKYFLKQAYNGGCDNHPDLQQQQLIAKQLTDYIANDLMHWKQIASH
ncbi:endoglucanase [Alphaproteobacteria bacterium]|nr:endoglucanase [Alphaproteobacteria bacterium]GHU81424.1 endoglucanase [Spirochaetia bacterium]